MATKDSAAPEGGSEISIEKLETQLNTLKTMFAEKQKLVSDLEAYGPEGETQLNIPKTMFSKKQKLVSHLKAYEPKGKCHSPKSSLAPVHM